MGRHKPVLNATGTSWINTDPPGRAETGETITWATWVSGLVVRAGVLDFTVSNPNPIGHFVDLRELLGCERGGQPCDVLCGHIGGPERVGTGKGAYEREGQDLGVSCGVKVCVNCRFRLWGSGVC